MIDSEIKTMDRMIGSLITDGASNSAERLLHDTVRELIGRPYQIETDLKYVVHYTSMSALFSILSCPIEHDTFFSISSIEQSKNLNRKFEFLRMYDSYSFNDPNEGRFFVDSAFGSHPFARNHRDLWSFLMDSSKNPAYIASFRGVSDIAEIDDLVFWRTYGKEGRGCAIVFPVSFFGSNTPVFQVQYGTRSVQSTLDNLSSIFDSIESAQYLRQHRFLPASSLIPKIYSSSLSPLSYLHKHKIFKYEKEVRIVVPFEELSRTSPVCHRIHDRESGLKLRHYVNLPALNIDKILRTNSMIILGPAVSSKRNLGFVLKQRLRRLGLPGATICESKIDYQS